MQFKHLISYSFISLFIVACSMVEKHHLDVQYGNADPANRNQSVFGTQGSLDNQSLLTYQDIKPILDKRCVVCHACYDAPCQLKLSSYDGLERGASKDKVYNAARLSAAPPSRLFEDAQTTGQWRHRGFFPVLNERQQSPDANLDASVMARLLMLKQQQPLPETALLPDSFDFSLDNANHCPEIEAFSEFALEKPLWGMPYGLPALPEQEYKQLIQWLSQGAAYGSQLSGPDAKEQQQIRQWERFFNGDSLKHQLMSRYIYEHLFIARLYFSEDNNPAKPMPQYYRLIRSSTPPGEPVRRVVTRRPYDDPGVQRVYYRLVPDHTTSVVKTHMPYQLNRQRMQRYQALFIDENYQVSQLPGYDLHTAANPFISFQDIPVKSRYQFMLDEAEFTIMGFIKGPVCRGQVALNVIQDHFWVFFIDPDIEFKEHDSRFLMGNLKHMNLPAEDSSSASLFDWFKFSEQEEQYLKLKSELIDHAAEKIKLHSIWDGDRHNKNAALSVFRHFDSASVVKGLIGKKPKTAWVIDYPLLERIHYLLVSGFDVYGNYAHQLDTRLYMDFLRMEGEFNFLEFLPEQTRIKERDEWYKNASDDVKNHLYGRYAHLNSESHISFQTDNHKNELFDLLKTHLGSALNTDYELLETNETDIQLLDLEEIRGAGVKYLPQVIFLMIEDEQQTSAYTLIHNNAHLNISHLFAEGSELISDDDTITITRGFVGSYPNVFFIVEKQRLPVLVDAIKNIKTEQDYTRLVNNFGVRRNDVRFWSISDKLHDIFYQSQPVQAGLFDYNRYENR